MKCFIAFAVVVLGVVPLLAYIGYCMFTNMDLLVGAGIVLAAMAGVFVAMWAVVTVLECLSGT